jgi:hypothetical protein
MRFCNESSSEHSRLADAKRSCTKASRQRLDIEREALAIVMPCGSKRRVNRPEFARCAGLAFCAVVRTRRATASRCVHASASGCRPSRWNRTRAVAPWLSFGRPFGGGVHAPADLRSSPQPLHPRRLPGASHANRTYPLLAATLVGLADAFLRPWTPKDHTARRKPLKERDNPLRRAKRTRKRSGWWAGQCLTGGLRPARSGNREKTAKCPSKRHSRSHGSILSSRELNDLAVDFPTRRTGNSPSLNRESPDDEQRSDRIRTGIRQALGGGSLGKSGRCPRPIRPSR